VYTEKQTFSNDTSFGPFSEPPRVSLSAALLSNCVVSADTFCSLALNCLLHTQVAATLHLYLAYGYVVVYQRCLKKLLAVLMDQVSEFNIPFYTEQGPDFQNFVRFFLSSSEDFHRSFVSQ